ncbi:porphobilinogen deaminase-like isoform X1 [Ostrea edulis]|uniref:porphobilinogen deaminase-like isoform X1 n=1 Tax=Ostrea edulis TaxID=37623 RepID=UPI0024AFD42D|nr:porphobilinogen deaminase-like isoform X1 [Ostrea edulis]
MFKKNYISLEIVYSFVCHVDNNILWLALIQTNTVINHLKKLNPHLTFEIISMQTTGDKVLDAALSKIGEKNLFTRELEVALEKNEVDFVVHSLKDLPTVLPEGLLIGCIYKRDSPYDAVVMHPSNAGKKLEDLPDESVIGTSSLRRAAQLARKFPKFIFENIRGNLNTRFKKLDEDNKYSAIILAEAGLHRMGWQDRISQVLDKNSCMYAVSQGAMAVECRNNDSFTLSLLSQIHDPETVIQCVAERAFLKKLEGGCSVPVSAFSEIKDGKLSLTGGVFSIDGTRGKIETVCLDLPESIKETDELIISPNGPRQFAGVVGNREVSIATLEVAQEVGDQVADLMLKSEAKDILANAKAETAAAIIAEKQRKDAEKLRNGVKANGH